MPELLLDAAGRPPSPATLPGFHAGRPPRNKGRRYPADPPKIEEIVAVMRRTGDGLHGRRLRGLIGGVLGAVIRPIFNAEHLEQARDRLSDAVAALNGKLPKVADGGHPEVRVAELALDDVERDPFAGHLDGVRVAQLVGRKEPSLAGGHGEMHAGVVRGRSSREYPLPHRRPWRSVARTAAGDQGRPAVDPSMTHSSAPMGSSKRRCPGARAAASPSGSMPTSRCSRPRRAERRDLRARRRGRSRRGRAPR